MTEATRLLAALDPSDADILAAFDAANAEAYADVLARARWHPCGGGMWALKLRAQDSGNIIAWVWKTPHFENWFWSIKEDVHMPARDKYAAQRAARAALRQ